MGNTLTKCLALDCAIQLVGFLAAYNLKTEKFFDVTGSSTFVLLLIYSLVCSGKFHPRQVIQSGLVGTWAARLGLFLLLRVLRDGKDSRFDKVRGNWKKFLLFWSVQAVWVFLTLLPTLILNAKQEDKQLTTRDYIGWVIWLAGFLIEAIADYQKYTFRSNPANAQKWIQHGLWSRIRHPNYLGEILLWFGLFISASSTFSSTAEWLTVLSPVYVAFQLSQMSGIPILERRSIRRWSSDTGFVNYMRHSYRLIPYVY